MGDGTSLGRVRGLCTAKEGTDPAAANTVVLDERADQTAH